MFGRLFKKLVIVFGQFGTNSAVAMSLVDPSKTVKSIGSGKLFWIPGGSGKLSCEVITSRIGPSDVCGKLDYQDASVFFIESRNVHAVPCQLKGVVCALRLTSFPGTGSCQFSWRLGIIWKYTPDRDCLQVFVWKGKTCPARKGKSGAVPRFYFYDQSGSIKDFEDDFEYHHVSSYFTDHVFLNQVHGELPGNTSKDVSNRLNQFDRCFEGSRQGPDQTLLPEDCKRLVGVIPPRFQPGFFSSTKTVILPQPQLATPDWPGLEAIVQSQLPPHEFLPRMPPWFMKKSRKKKSKEEKEYSTWMFPPESYNFQTEEQWFHSVIVEDS